MMLRALRGLFRPAPHLRSAITEHGIRSDPAARRALRDGIATHHLQPMCREDRAFWASRQQKA